MYLSQEIGEGMTWSEFAWVIELSMGVTNSLHTSPELKTSIRLMSKDIYYCLMFVERVIQVSPFTSQISTHPASTYTASIHDSNHLYHIHVTAPARHYQRVSRRPPHRKIS